MKKKDRIQPRIFFIVTPLLFNQSLLLTYCSVLYSDWLKKIASIHFRGDHKAFYDLIFFKKSFYTIIYTIYVRFFVININHVWTWKRWKS